MCIFLNLNECLLDWEELIDKEESKKYQSFSYRAYFYMHQYILYHISLSLSLSQTFIRKYFVTGWTLKNIAPYYIWVHSSAIRPVPAFGAVWNYEPGERWKPNKFRGGAFPLRSGSASHAGRGFRATTQHYAAPDRHHWEFPLCETLPVPRPTSFLGDSFACNSLEENTSRNGQEYASLKKEQIFFEARERG